MLYPLTFQPIFKQLVWGGRELERRYGKVLPPEVPIGESWEISDRPNDVSVIANGPLAGKDLRWLMENCRTELLGNAPSPGGRFPLLLKILDAQTKLSLQVHPPAARAAELGGEPKTEMWYITQAAPGAELFAGLKRGVTRAEFERKIQDGTVADCFHRISARAGDALFLPSGRVHGLGAGLVLFEIQQNSDTTYRVFDWNRVGLDGKPRPLHIPQALASIDFNDFEPELLPAAWSPGETCQVRPLVRESVFAVEACAAAAGARVPLPPRKMQIVAMLAGRARIGDGSEALALAAGQFGLVPASLPPMSVCAAEPVTFLRIEL
ncbi:MAG TPA: class I mannose-6-phosphate isomerase [Verrucomicrobiota bacterium]|jgi:mannose-6-phosphate isomerase|nr:class I mannose-6-phosphate isomerase [Verrucomicrobiota bacterium]HCL92384.1 mannose-6-phosphate isomerase [Limisphaerales bacterium]HRR64082.1 class I mannose-6-phosphate isomerase [Candidatus Paceibacterota bacterium]MBP8013749.1 class I mannose-6-phosphate isomerase [Verrucomicrobiota bacterium]MDI9372414.1 class I mannose-6-phosphate isomerase [Verrucomicrobiota bacterium]